MICDKCKKNVAMHTSFAWWETPQEKHLCCSCHIAEGGIPADWHPLCVSAAQPALALDTATPSDNEAALRK